jgi:putative DNA primase/helicase
MTAAELAARLGLRRAGNGWMGPCPACGYPKGLRLNQRGGKAMWWCASGCDRHTLTAAVLGDAPMIAPRNSDAVPNDDRRDLAARMAEEALSARGSIVEPYLAGRAIALPPEPVIRFLPNAKHAPTGRRFGCMLSVMHDAEGRIPAVHRTFLAPGGAGKAPVDPAKMTLGPTRGAAVRLWPAAERLVVAEGIETALAAAALLGVPAWAATSAGNLGDMLMLPDTVREVVIAADHDRPGREAAQRAATRWKAEGRVVKIAVPDKPGEDFADLAQARASRGR